MFEARPLRGKVIVRRAAGQDTPAAWAPQLRSPLPIGCGLFRFNLPGDGDCSRIPLRYLEQLDVHYEDTMDVVGRLDSLGWGRGPSQRLAACVVR